ncbi:flavin reductase family protein [Thermoflavimicrobium dichotomicum]|uniref:NADH-FMN oxidoreductase RutF, flavin reductase (DIM6/NTAB) family n=1 Tax=Thermoflavimicrobium dichotomicum TaxID=46223 RepID=A0A1I3QHG7_9BACL|nr:flavin reductase family protein [Thermoflavimicrobium dichotomicum]SFJ32972.1 NADH-FMN oxidoreductase RutF, flavin reductase (DIM6/NTAB) family [Thermoflavimicrobium dichotomicum]
MQIDPRKQPRQANYKLLIGSVLPRPIAFVSSLNEAGKVNAAPFSFFTVVSTEPPLISVTCMRKPDGQMKDTARNISQQKEFVVHVVDSENVKLVNDTATDFPPEISEVDEVGFELLPSVEIKTPRIAQSKVQMECVLHQMIPMGGNQFPNADLIIGEVVQFHIADELYHDGKIDTLKLDPVGRLAGTMYGTVGETFSMPRLTWNEWQEKER